jgi:hypothetical protein
MAGPASENMNTNAGGSTNHNRRRTVTPTRLKITCSLILLAIFTVFSALPSSISSSMNEQVIHDTGCPLKVTAVQLGSFAPLAYLGHQHVQQQQHLVNVPSVEPTPIGAFHSLQNLFDGMTLNDNANGNNHAANNIPSGTMAPNTATSASPMPSTAPAAVVRSTGFGNDNINGVLNIGMNASFGSNHNAKATAGLLPQDHHLQPVFSLQGLNVDTDQNLNQPVLLASTLSSNLQSSNDSVLSKDDVTVPTELSPKSNSEKRQTATSRSNAKKPLESNKPDNNVTVSENKSVNATKSQTQKNSKTDSKTNSKTLGGKFENLAWGVFGTGFAYYGIAKTCDHAGKLDRDAKEKVRNITK